MGELSAGTEAPVTDNDLNGSCWPLSWLLVEGREVLLDDEDVSVPLDVVDCEGKDGQSRVETRLGGLGGKALEFSFSGDVPLQC